MTILEKILDLIDKAAKETETTPTKEEKMEEKYEFKVGDEIEALFNGERRRGIITSLTPRDYARNKVAVRFDHYSYASDEDFHGWSVKDLTKVECFPLFKTGERVYVNCLDEHSDEGMKHLVGTWGEVDNPRFLPHSGKDKKCVSICFSEGNYFFCESSLRHEGDVKSAPPDLIKREKEEELGRAYGMSETKIAERRRTVAATIILATGLEVRVPDPVGKDWVLTKTVKVEGIHGFSIGMDAFSYYFSGAHFMDSVSLRHKEAICWMKDMRRIVEERSTKSPFDERYAYVTELRYFEERPPIVEVDDPAYPTLKAYLW